MPDRNALYDDMEKLNALYQELCWDHDDELVFTHDGKRVIVCLLYTSDAADE